MSTVSALRRPADSSVDRSPQRDLAPTATVQSTPFLGTQLLGGVADAGGRQLEAASSLHGRKAAKERERERKGLTTSWLATLSSRLLPPIALNEAGLATDTWSLVTISRSVGRTAGRTDCYSSVKITQPSGQIGKVHHDGDSSSMPFGVKRAIHAFRPCLRFCIPHPIVNVLTTEVIFCMHPFWRLSPLSPNNSLQRKATVHLHREPSLVVQIATCTPTSIPLRGGATSRLFINAVGCGESHVKRVVNLASNLPAGELLKARSVVDS